MNERNHSTVYGPVMSWRVGRSLGIDLILETSTCSFNCIYCQLGTIQRITAVRQEFVQTAQVVQDFLNSRWQESDIITYSGSGEPTLATNLGTVVRELKRITSIPQLVLTNGTTLDNPEVRRDLEEVDKVFIKLDAASEEMFQRINRPAPGISLQGIVHSAEQFRRSSRAYLGIQTMFMPANLSEADRLCEWLNRIQPDEVQLNTPTRPYPKEWHLSSRGGHSPELRDYQGVSLRKLPREQAMEIEQMIREKTGLKVISIYKPEG